MPSMPLWTSEYPGLKLYYCATGRSNKFWGIWKKNIDTFMTFWCRVGNSPQTSQKQVISYCLDDRMNAMIQSKLDKGYKIVGTVPDKKNPVLKMESATIKPGDIKYLNPEPEELLGNALDYLEID